MIEPAEILLVEDDPNDIRLALYALKRHQLAGSIHVVHDGAEALEFLFCTGAYADRQMANPKVVLLDLKLPKVSGIEVLRSLRSDERTRSIPIVVLTSSQEHRDVEECYRFGVNSYVVKPVDFDAFAEALQQVGRYWISLNHPSMGPGRS